MNLYEINEELVKTFSACIDPETGEVINEEMLDKFEQLQMDRDEKIENICLYIKNLKSDAAALKAEKEAFDKRQKAVEKKAEGLTKYLQGFLKGEKFKSSDGRAVVSYRKSESVNVTDITKVPIEYLTMADPKANKTAIKEALKRGDAVPGAELVTNQNMLIK